MKRRVCAAVVVLAALGPGVQAAAPPAGPHLVVVVSVDGLSWPRLAAYRPWFVAGLKRLLDEGQVETACRYRHLNTETGPGHSSLATGAPPRVTGIVANAWFEHDAQGAMRLVGCVVQPNPAPVPGSPPLFYREVERDGRLHVFASRRELAAWERSGETGKTITRLGYGPSGETVVFDGEDAVTLFNVRHARPEESFPSRASIAGPGNLRVPTLGDRLVEAHATSRVVSLSAKDRSAILLAGHDARHAVYWFDQASGRFTTSLAYDTQSEPGASAAALVARLNNELAGARLPSRFGARWPALPLAPGLVPPSPPPLWAPVAGAFNPYPTPRLADFQIPSNGLGFDHDLLSPGSSYFGSLYVSPYIDELLADFALAFVEDEAYGLGRGAGPDVLELSFSAQDVVSHSYGQESEENLDVLRRLDVQLGRLLTALDRSLPKGSVVLALSADHGFAPIPESEKRWDNTFPVGRLVTGTRPAVSFVDRLNRLLADALCLPASSKVVYGVEGWNVSYDYSSLPLRTIAGACGPEGALVGRAELDAVLPHVVDRSFHEEIQEVLLVSRRADWPASDPAVEFAQNDFDAERSGDAFLVPQPHVLMHWDPARGSGHGTHYDYDTNVPLVFWGGPFHARTVDSASVPYDLAPTLAELLGITLPAAIGHSRLPRQ